jgi:hypothetical protein
MRKKLRLRKNQLLLKILRSQLRRSKKNKLKLKKLMESRLSKNPRNQLQLNLLLKRLKLMSLLKRALM